MDQIKPLVVLVKENSMFVVYKRSICSVGGGGGNRNDHGELFHYMGDA